MEKIYIHSKIHSISNYLNLILKIYEHKDNLNPLVIVNKKKKVQEILFHKK